MSDGPDVPHTAQTPTTTDAVSNWVDVGSTKEVKRKRSLVVAGDREEVAVFWHDDRACALANICIHKQKEISRGMIFKDRIVCPGHQWGFDLETGHCAERERTQPVYRSRIVDDRVEVDLSAPVNEAQLDRDD